MALFVGVAVECSLVAALFLGGITYFGPSSPWGRLVVIPHTPALWLFGVLGVPEPLSEVLAVAACVAAWSGLAFLVLGLVLA
jgi:hypothetical protein